MSNLDTSDASWLPHANVLACPRGAPAAPLGHSLMIPASSRWNGCGCWDVLRWSSNISSSAPWATIGPVNDCLMKTPTASPPPLHGGLRDPGSSDAPGSNHHGGSQLGIRPYAASPPVPHYAWGSNIRRPSPPAWRVIGSSSSGHPAVSPEGRPPRRGTTKGRQSRV